MPVPVVVVARGAGGARREAPVDVAEGRVRLELEAGGHAVVGHVVDLLHDLVVGKLRQERQVLVLLLGLPHLHGGGGAVGGLDGDGGDGGLGGGAGEGSHFRRVGCCGLLRSSNRPSNRPSNSSSQMPCSKCLAWRACPPILCSSCSSSTTWARRPHRRACEHVTATAADAATMTTTLTPTTTTTTTTITMGMRRQPRIRNGRTRSQASSRASLMRCKARG